MPFVFESVDSCYPKQARRDFFKWVRDTKQLIERVPKFREHLGKVCERVVIVNKPDEGGRASVSILFYDSGDHYWLIDMPNLDLALEFDNT